MARDNDTLEADNADELIETKRENVDGDDKKKRRDPDNAPVDQTEDGGLTASGETEFVELDDDTLTELGTDRRQSADERGLDASERTKRNREERAEKKRRRREFRERDRSTINALQNRLASLGQQVEELRGGTHRQTLAGVDEKLGTAQRLFANAKAELADALEKNDTGRVMKALDDRDAARDAYNQLSAAKRRLAERPAEREERDQPKPLSDRAQAHARRFQEEIGLESLAEDEQRELYLLDSGVRQMGYDPDSKEYWDELRKRAKRRGFELDADDEDDDEEATPKKRRTRQEAAEVDEDDPPAQRRPPVSTFSGEVSRGGKRGVVLPKEFIDGCKAAGKWDDPETRKRMIKRYQASSAKYNVGRRAA